MQLERADDLGLPPRTITVRRDYFSPEEKELYLSLFSDAKREFSYYVDQGSLLNSMLFSARLSYIVLNLLLRLLEHLQLVWSMAIPVQIILTHLIFQDHSYETDGLPCM